MTAENLKQVVVEALDDIKAQDVTVLDVSEKTTVTDFMVIASGTSNRHVKAIADSVAEDAGKKGFKAMSQEGEAGSEWVLLDFGDLILHVMLPEARAYYDIERLWEGTVADEENQAMAEAMINRT